MKSKTVTIVGILFNKEELEEILDYLTEKTFFSKNDQKEFYRSLDNGIQISDAYKKIIHTKKIENPPLMEIMDADMSSDEYFFGYRIQQEVIEIPTNLTVLNQIKEAQENWFRLFDETPQTESVSFDIY